MVELIASGYVLNDRIIERAKDFDGLIFLSLILSFEDCSFFLVPLLPLLSPSVQIVLLLLLLLLM